jgi:hypothetical protein
MIIELLWRRKLAAALLVVGLAFPGWAQEGVNVALDPAPQLAAGESTTLHVRVEGLRDRGLAAFQLTIVYDPSSVRVHDPNAQFVSAGLDAFAPLGSISLCAPIRGESSCPDEPWLLTSTGRSAVGRTDLDESAGRVLIAYATSGSEPAASGDGAIALVDVESLDGGPIELSLEDVILTDASNPPRPHPLADAQGGEALHAGAEGER